MLRTFFKGRKNLSENQQILQIHFQYYYIPEQVEQKDYLKHFGKVLN